MFKTTIGNKILLNKSSLVELYEIYFGLLVFDQVNEIELQIENKADLSTTI